MVLSLRSPSSRAACHSVAVPLNPKLTATELDNLFATLRIDAMVTSNQVASLARDVASRHGICLLELANSGPGIFTISAGSAATSARHESAAVLERGAQPDALALILPHFRHHRAAEAGASDLS